MNKKHNGTIDFLKFLFACLIMAFHGNSMIVAKGGYFCYGATGVEFFFLVSGFLMAVSAQKALRKENMLIGSETAGFVLAKVKRLFPYILLAFMITLPLRETIKETDPSRIPQDLYTSIWELSLLWISGISGTVVNAPTWYISAMLVSMLLLYPLLLKNFDLFTKVLAPLISIFLLGWMSYTYGKLDNPNVWTELCYKGLLRAIAEMALGCVCYSACQWLMRFRFKPAGKWLLSLIEWGCYIFVIAACAFFGKGSVSFIMLLALSIGITISFSQQSATTAWFRFGFFSMLGQFSLAIYVIHYPIRMIFIYMKPDLGYWTQMGLFFLASFIAGLLAMLVINWQSIQKKIKEQ